MASLRSWNPCLWACLAVPLALSACSGRDEDQTVGQRVDSALGRAGEVAREVQEGGREAGRDARTATMGAASRAKQAASQAGAKVDDAKITSQVNDSLAQDKDFGTGAVDVTTREGVVTLRGTAPSAAAKARAAEIARNVKDVKSVENQLSVRGG